MIIHVAALDFIFYFWVASSITVIINFCWPPRMDVELVSRIHSVGAIVVELVADKIDR